MLHIHIPMILKRKDGRKMIIAPNALDGVNFEAEPVVQQAVIQVLVRAQAWCMAIERSEVESISELARILDMDGSYMTRILKLSTLAPDIKEAILKGKEPNGLSQADLLKPFPSNWEEQRVHFGFAT